MVKVTVKTKFNYKILNKWKKNSSKALASALKKNIVREIKSGTSPVSGKGRFRRYSKSYRDAIKKGRVDQKQRVSPVNLTQTGAMLKSIFSKQNKKGFKIGFKSLLADIHNRQGASKIKVIRRMLPSNAGEVFNKAIQNDIQIFLNKARKKLKNKINS